MGNTLRAKGIPPDGLMAAVCLVMNRAPFHVACILVYKEQPYQMCLEQLTPREMQMGFALS